MFWENPSVMGCPARRIGCCSVRGHYRPNRTPGTKRGIGAHVRTARQSRDCLRVRPSRAPPLFVAVRSALGPVLPTVAQGALAALRSIPAPRGPLRPLRGSLRSGNLIASRQAHPTVSIGVSLRIRSHLYGLWSRAEYRPSPYPRTSAASAQSRLSQRLKCTCAAGIRLANERSEELCEAKSQEPAPHG